MLITPTLKTTAAASPTPTQIAEKQLGAQPPTHEQIAARAHEKFVAAGSQTGNCTQYWLEAETELKQQAAAPGGLDKASATASLEMASEGAGGAVGNSATSGVVVRPVKPATPAGTFATPNVLQRPAGR